MKDGDVDVDVDADVDEIKDYDQIQNKLDKNDEEIKQDAGEPMQIQGYLNPEKGNKIIWTGKSIPNMRYVLK